MGAPLIVAIKNTQNSVDKSVDNLWVGGAWSYRWGVHGRTPNRYEPLYKTNTTYTSITERRFCRGF